MGAAESGKRNLDHAASHCNRPSEPGQGSSTRRGRAATWSIVASFSWRNTTESDLTLKMFTHFSQTVVLTREPPYIVPTNGTVEDWMDQGKGSCWTLALSAIVVKVGK